MYEELLTYVKTQQEPIAESLRGCGFDIAAHKDDSLDDLLNFAKKNINVFPYSNVKPCWFQLYANVSISKVVDFLGLINHVNATDVKRNNKIFSDAVASLDNALIIAGGGSEDTKNLIHEILQRLDHILYPQVSHCNDDDNTDDLYDYNDDERESKGPPTKKRRLDTSSTVNPPSHSLPSGLAFVPKLKHPIPRLINPSLAAFESRIHTSNTPLTLKNTLTHWPALTRWHDPEYWLRRTLDGHRLVPIELGQSYTDEGWRQEIMTFGRFLNEYVLKGDDAEEIGYLAQHDLFNQIPELRADVAVPDYCFVDVPVQANGAAEVGGVKDTEDDTKPATKAGSDVFGDLANIATTNQASTQNNSRPEDRSTSATSNPPSRDLHQESSKDCGQIQSSRLKHSNSSLDSITPSSPSPSSPHSSPETPLPQIHQNIWFGTRTVTPLHHDPYSNILTQIHGTKYIRIYSPDYTSLLYPRSSQEPAPHLTDRLDSPNSVPQCDRNDDRGSSHNDSGDTSSAQEPQPSATIDMSNTSTIPLWSIEQSPHEDWDEQFPGFSGVPYFEGLLGEGDAVYIPKGWWHYVRGVSAVGIGVSFWW